MSALKFGACLFGFTLFFSCNNSPPDNLLIDAPSTPEEEMINNMERDESIDDEEGHSTFLGFGEFAISINHFQDYAS